MNTLPQDRESLFYFNLREIPPKSSKPNTLQLALQTRIKLFYRPAPLAVNPNDKPWQEKVTLTREGGNLLPTTQRHILSRSLMPQPPRKAMRKRASSR